MAGNVNGVPSDVENTAAKKTGGKAGERSKSMCSRGLALIKKIRNAQQGRYLPIWSTIFVTSCVFAVSLDPFFFYVVIIDQDNKCLEIDKTLSIVAFLMRTITDVIFLVHLICEICDAVQNPKPKTLKKGASLAVGQTGENSDKKSKIRELIDQAAMNIAQKMPWLSVFTVIDFFALLPLPQLLIGVIFYTMKGSGFVEHRNILNFFLLFQYFPRIYRIYLSAKEFKMTNGIWAKGLYNMFLYILSSHVLGAFWYFFSVERELTCWQEACVNHSKDPRACLNTLSCDSRSTTKRNITFLNEHCPLDTPNGASSPFNFGIFLDSLQNQNTEHILFRKKFFYSFWWGLRNLSNFGTNLMTSTYVFENLFAVLISVTGLLLFLYLIGNVQTFMQMEATKTEEMREKIRLKKLDVRTWMSRNEIPDDLKEEILSNIKRKLKRHIDADLHNFLFYILPVNVRTSLKHFLCMNTLKKVKRLQDMDDKVLKLICDYLKPVRYTENSFIFRMGDPLDCMLFIIEGTVWTYESTDSQAGQGISSMDTKPLRKGDFYGEKLLDCASHHFTKLPVSSKHVKSQTKVEAFVLMAKDLETVVSKYRLKWKKNEKRGSQGLEYMAASIIVAAFRRHLTHLRNKKRALPVGYSRCNFGTNLTTSTYVWENLFAILSSIVGLLLFLYLIGNVQTFMQMEAIKKEKMRRKIKRKKRDVKDWMKRNELPQEIEDEILSSIKQTLKQHIDADLHNFLFSILPVEIRRSLKRCLGMKILKKVKKLQDMNEHVLTLMCEYLKPVKFIENSFVLRMGEPLDCMLFIIEGTVRTYASSDGQAGQGISSMATKPLRKDDFYVEELLDLASNSFTELPVSSKYVKTQTKVEAFLLTAKDLETVISICPLRWWKSEKKISQKLEDIAASTIGTAYRRHVRLQAIKGFPEAKGMTS